MPCLSLLCTFETLNLNLVVIVACSKTTSRIDLVSLVSTAVLDYMVILCRNHAFLLFVFVFCTMEYVFVIN